jgi:Fe-S cluster assembly iron-binding protein IscA
VWYKHGSRAHLYNAQQLRNISMRDRDEDLALRVLVESGGCHGYQYKLELTSKRQPSD